MAQPARLNSSLSYYIGNISQPHYGKTAPVQKGLLPCMNDLESDLCEEGVGFGVPIIQYKRDFFFPGKSITSYEGKIKSGTFWKKYTMDLIDRRQGRHSTQIDMLSWAPQRLYNRIYKSFYGRSVLRFIESRFEFLRPDFDPSVFFKVRDRGTVLVTYVVDSDMNEISVTMDFSGIHTAGLQYIYISNELGGNLFDVYTDSAGVVLRGDAIGAWDRIDASWATLYSSTRRIGFCVSIPGKIQAFRGREIIGRDICWSGIIFMAPPSTTMLNYRIVMTKKLRGD